MEDLVEGQTYYVKGSGKKPFKLKLEGGVYSCSCPAWCGQSVPASRRTCKHLRMMRGDAAEAARCDGSYCVSGTVTGRKKTSPPIQFQTLRHGSKTKISPGCACERGSICDVSHDPATCPCAQCTTAELLTLPVDYAGIERELVRKNPEILRDPLGTKDAHIAPVGTFMASKDGRIRELEEENEKLFQWLLDAYQQCKACPECGGDNEHEADCELEKHLQSR